MLKTLPRYAIATLFCASLLLVGCATIGQSAGSAKPDPKKAPSANRIPLRVGDSLKVTLVMPARPGLPSQPQELKITLKEDGTIALPYFPAIPAVGKTTKELEQEIYNKYVPDYYKTLGVTVEPDAQFIFIGGEVVKNGRLEYLGPITVTQAIQSAQGFTEYANKKKIYLTRADGKKIKVNFYDASENPSKDPQMYPGDSIRVERRIF